MARKQLDPKAARRAITRAAEISEPPPAPSMFRGKKQLFFEALLSGSTVKEACEVSGFHRSHAFKVEQDEGFQRALNDARSERVKIAQEAVAELVPLAMRRLGDILKSPISQDKDVIAAAREVLDRGGMPKTERVEHSGSVDADLSDIEDLLSTIRDAAEMIGPAKTLPT